MKKLIVLAMAGLFVAGCCCGKCQKKAECKEEAKPAAAAPAK